MRRVLLSTGAALVIGLAETGIAVTRRFRAEGADVVVLEVQHEAEQASGKLHELSGHGPFEAVNARDAVADFEHPADLAGVDLRLVLADLRLEN